VAPSRITVDGGTGEADATCRDESAEAAGLALEAALISVAVEL